MRVEGEQSWLTRRSVASMSSTWVQPPAETPGPETVGVPSGPKLATLLTAATGASGGGDLTQISPGEQVVLRWKATRTGVFVYHCIPGGPMIPWHIASGMSGVVMVLPRDGLKDGNGKPLHYDRVYYIGEQDFYVPRDEKGKFKTYESHADAFADEIDCQIAHARTISTRPGEALHEFGVHWVAADPEYDGSGDVEHRVYRQLLGDDHLGIGRGQRVPHGIHLLLPGRPVRTDRQIVALDPSALAQS